MLGAPQAQDDGFDDIADYATTEAWKDEANTSECATENASQHTIQAHN